MRVQQIEKENTGSGSVSGAFPKRGCISWDLGLFILAVGKYFWGVYYFLASHPYFKWLSCPTLVIGRSKECYLLIYHTNIQCVLCAWPVLTAGCQQSATKKIPASVRRYTTNTETTK